MMRTLFGSKEEATEFCSMQSAMMAGAPQWSAIMDPGCTLTVAGEQ